MFYKNKVFLMVILIMLAMIFVGCNLVTPGADGELSAVVKIIDAPESMWGQDINWWQTKDTKEVSRNRYPLILITEVKPLGSGNVTPGGTYAGGTQLTLVATEVGDWKFDYWSKTHGTFTGSAFNPTIVFTMPDDENAIVTAHFIVNTPDVDVEVPVNCGDVDVDITLPIWNSEFDKYVYVYFNIENTGADIQEYTVTFTAYGTTPGIGTPIKSTDYTTYTGIATGKDLAAGENRDSFAQIDVSNDKVVWVELASLELQ